jgi:hypothetical protein
MEVLGSEERIPRNSLKLLRRELVMPQQIAK